MSEINYQALREAAERAIPAMERLLMLPVDDDLLSEQELKDYGVDIDALNAFKFLTGPETVLALLDERERNQQYIKSRDQENEEIALTVGKLRVELEAAEKRIAELESLTAPQLPQPAPVSVPEVVGWKDVPEEITEDDIAIASAWAYGFNQCRAAMLQCADGSLAHEGENHPEDKLGMVDHFGGSNNMVEPVTDNTNQQFESLSRGDK